ncbi:MAG: response regulator [Candidatus Aminicenantes bacterium]|nr:response regulator [Candidatus Aminicenantes bacterium]
MMKNKGSILIMEPNPEDREGFAGALRRQEYEVHTCGNFVNALEKLRKKDFDCVIINTYLPGLKGYEAASILRQFSPTTELIMITNDNTRELEARSREENIFYYYVKSPDIEELVLAVNNLFEKLKVGKASHVPYSSKHKKSSR